MPRRGSRKKERAPDNPNTTEPVQETELKVRLGFAASADAFFKRLSQREQKGLLRKLKDLALNPRLGKPLTGQLAGHCRIMYGRLRCVVRTIDKTPVLLVVVLIALRAEGTRDDVYQLAVKALRSDPSIEQLFAAHVRAYLEEMRSAQLRQ